MKGMVRDPIMVLLLSFITCGIYPLYWIYTIGTELKLYLGDTELNPGLYVVLSIICFPFSYFVIYQYSKKLFEAQLRCNVPGASENSLMYVLIGIFIFPVTLMLMQTELNKVWQSN